MCIKLIFLLLACAAASPSPASTPQQTYGLIQEIQKALENLKRIIDKVITDALDNLNNILNAILDLSKGIFVSVTNKIGEIVKDTIRKINELAGKAEDAGIDVTECIVGKNEDIAAIPENLIKETVSCVEENVQQAKTVVNEAINDVKNALGVIDKLQESVKQCGSGLAAIPCLTGILVQVGVEIIQLPLVITKRVAQAVVYIATIEAEMVECETNTVVTAGVEIGLVFQGVVKCIENKQRESFANNHLTFI